MQILTKISIAIAYCLLLQELAHAATLTFPSVGIVRTALVGRALQVDFQEDGKSVWQHFQQQAFDECSQMRAYALKGRGELVVDGSCPSRNGQMYIEVYRWNATGRQWCLIRDITGESADPFSGDWLGSPHVDRIEGCSAIGNDGSAQTESAATVSRGVSDELNHLMSIAPRSDSGKAAISALPFYFAIEVATNINSVNVERANDLAFFMTRYGNVGDALPLLQAIVSRYPDRIVAKLNLADALWDVGQHDQAKRFYADYTKSMNQAGKTAIVPVKVRQRVGTMANER